MDIKFKKILEEDNVAELLSAEERLTLGNECHRLYEDDFQSDSEYFNLNEQITKLLGPFLETKSYPYEGSSNVNVPLIINACIAFASRAYAILFKDDQVCYAKVLGADADEFKIMDESGALLPKPVQVSKAGEKAKRAARVSEFMSNQLLYEDENWEEDTDKLLLQYSAYGEMYRMRYHDANTEKERSQIIHPNNLIIHSDTVDFEKARKTRKFSLYPYEIKGKILTDWYVDFEYQDDKKETSHDFIEQYTRVDLDGDGYAEPYIITVHCQTKNATRIVKAFSERGVKYNDKKVVNIECENYFIRYVFLPDARGKFRGIGFGYLLFNINNNVNSSVNQMNDAGRLANTPAILAGRGIRMKGGEMPLKTGRMHFVDSTGRALRDDIYEIRFPEPSRSLYELAVFLIGFGKELGGLKDVLSGQMRSDLPANTALALIEQGMNEFKSIFKRLYRAMSKEFKILYKMNAEYLDQDYYRVFGDGEAYRVKKDFEQDGLDIVPVADFSALTSIEKQYKATALREMAAQGLVNPKFAAKVSLEALNIPDIEDALNFEPTNQELQLQQTLADAQQKEAEAKLLTAQNDSREIVIKEKKTSAEIAKIKAEVLDLVEKAEQRNDGEMIKNIQGILGIIQGIDENDNKGSINGLVAPQGDAASNAVA